MSKREELIVLLDEYGASNARLIVDTLDGYLGEDKRVKTADEVSRWDFGARRTYEAIDKIREVLGSKTSDPFVVACDVKELVEAIESRCDAFVVLKRIRGEK